MTEYSTYFIIIYILKSRVKTKFISWHHTQEDAWRAYDAFVVSNPALHARPLNYPKEHPHRPNPSLLPHHQRLQKPTLAVAVSQTKTASQTAVSLKILFFMRM